MNGDDKFVALLDLIYEAVLDNDLWPVVLVRIADALGVPQVGMPAYDWHSNVYTTFAPRFDPELLASYSMHWAFEEPIVPRAMLRPAGEIFMLDDLMPRQEFATTPVFNEWWRAGRMRPCRYGCKRRRRRQLHGLDRSVERARRGRPHVRADSSL